jgi:hydroxyacylglutathione hydrolase
MIVEKLAVGPLQANSYILGCEETRKALVIDPGGEPERIESRIRDLGLELLLVLGTHAHLDHVLGVRDLCQSTGAPFLLHRLDEPLLARLQEWTRQWLGVDPGPPPTVDRYVEDGETVRFGACELEVRLTPGHSPGSVSLVDGGRQNVFVGDLLFSGSIGRSDLPGGDPDTLIQSVEERIFTLGDDCTVLSGHGPATSVGRERQHNPFFGQRSGLWR